MMDVTTLPLIETLISRKANEVSVAPNSTIKTLL